MRPGGKRYATGKGSPEGTPPVRPPQAAFREIFCAAVQSHIDAVLVPEGIAEPHRHIVGSRRLHLKAVGHRTVIAKGGDAVFNGDDAGCRGIIAGVPVDVYRSELCLLLFAVGSQISPAVVCPHKLGILTGNGVRPFHVVIDMGKGIGYLIVIVPIGHDGEKGLRRRIVREIVAARHPQLGGIVGVGRSPVGFPQVLRRVVDLPVPAVGRHTEEYLIRVHDLRGVIVNALQPASWGNRPRCGACPCHAVGHDGRGIAVSVQVAVNAPVLTAHRAVDGSHPRQADVHVLCGVIGFHRIVDIAEHRRGLCVGGIAVPTFQVDVNAIAPGILLHDADDLREEHLLRPVCVVPQGAEDAVCAIVGHGQKPLDMGPPVDVGEHIRDRHTAFIDFSGRSYFKGEQPDLADAVAVIPQGFVHPGVAHERPYHDLFAF